MAHFHTYLRSESSPYHIASTIVVFRAAQQYSVPRPPTGFLAYDESVLLCSHKNPRGADFNAELDLALDDATARDSPLMLDTEPALAEEPEFETDDDNCANPLRFDPDTNAGFGQDTPQQQQREQPDTRAIDANRKDRVVLRRHRKKVHCIIPRAHKRGRVGNKLD